VRFCARILDDRWARVKSIQEEPKKTDITAVKNDLLKNCESLYERLDRSNYERRTYLRSRNGFLLDLSRASAARMYRENWGGCRDCWKQNYRQRKKLYSNPN
jgi:hypothetical protein